MNDMLTKRRCRDEAFHLLLPWTLRHSPVQDAIEVVLLHGVLAKAVRVFGRIHEYKKKSPLCGCILLPEHPELLYCTYIMQAGLGKHNDYSISVAAHRAHLAICPPVHLSTCRSGHLSNSPSHVSVPCAAHVFASRKSTVGTRACDILGADTAPRHVYGKGSSHLTVIATDCSN